MRKLMGGFFGFLRRNKQRKGFTLAEALVVLAIIGIIAVLVLPVITTRAQNRGFSLAYDAEVKEMLNSLEGLTLHENAKSFNETIMNVPLNVDGEVTEDQAAAAINADALEGARQYLQRYTKVARYCGNITTPCFAQNYSMYEGRVRGIFPLAGIVSGGQPYRVNGVDLNYGPMVCALLKNGMSLCISPQVTDSTGRMVRPVRGFIDLNGPKEPNVLGRDLRSFSMDLATRTITSPDAGTINLSDTEPPCEGTACCVQHYNEGILEEPDVNGQPHNCCETLQNGGQLTGEESLKYCCTINSDIADINDPCCDYLRGKGVSTENLPDECKEDSSLTPCEMFALGRTEYKEQCCATQSDPYWNNSDDTHTWDKACCVLAEYKDQCCANKGLSYWTPASKWNDECCNKEPYKTNDPVCNQCSSENWTDACCSDVTDDNPIWREKCCQIDEHKNKIACCSTTDDGKNRKGEDNDICCNNDAGLNTLGLSRNPECCYIKQWFANCCDVASGQKGTGKKDKNNRTWEDHCCSEPIYANEEACCKADGKNGQGNVSQECCSFIENKNANCCEYMSQEDPSSPYGEYCCLSSSYDAEDPCCKVFGKGCPLTCDDDAYFNDNKGDCCQQAAYANDPRCCNNGKNIVTNMYSQVCCNVPGLSGAIKDACCEAGITPAGYTCPEPPCTDPDVHVGWGLRAGTSDQKWWFELPAGMTAKQNINGVKYEYILYDVVDGACTNCSEPKTISPNIAKDKGRGTGNNNFIHLGGKKLYIKRVSSAPSIGDCPKYIFDDYGTSCDCQTACTPNKIHLKTKVKEVGTACGANSTREETYWIESDRDVDDDVVVTLSAYFQHMAIGSSTPDSSDTNLISKTLTIHRGDKKSNEVTLVSHIYPNNTTIGYSDDLTCYDPSTIGYYFNVSISGNDEVCYPDDFDGECPAGVTALDASWGCCNDWGEDKVRDSHNQGAIDACCQFPDLKERWALCGGCTINANLKCSLAEHAAHTGCKRTWDYTVKYAGTGGVNDLVCPPNPTYNGNIKLVTKTGNCAKEPTLTLQVLAEVNQLWHCTGAHANDVDRPCYSRCPKSCTMSGVGNQSCTATPNPFGTACDCPDNPAIYGEVCKSCARMDDNYFPTAVEPGLSFDDLDAMSDVNNNYNSNNGKGSITYTEEDAVSCSDARRSMTYVLESDSEFSAQLVYTEKTYKSNGDLIDTKTKSKAITSSTPGQPAQLVMLSEKYCPEGCSKSACGNTTRISNVQLSNQSVSDCVYDIEMGSECQFPEPGNSRPTDLTCADYEDDRSNPQWSALNCCSLDAYYADESCCNGKNDGKGNVSATCCQKVGTFSGPEDECCNMVTNHNDAWLSGCCEASSTDDDCCEFRIGTDYSKLSPDDLCCSSNKYKDRPECKTPCDKVAAGTATYAEKKACCDNMLDAYWEDNGEKWAAECCTLTDLSGNYAYKGTSGMSIFSGGYYSWPKDCCPYWRKGNVLVYNKEAYDNDPQHLAGACNIYDTECIKSHFSNYAADSITLGVCWLSCYDTNGNPDTANALYCCDKWYADGKFNNGANSALKDTCCNEPINKTWDICNTTACPSANDATPARATKECCSQWLTGSDISMLMGSKPDVVAACCANDEWAAEHTAAGYCCNFTPHSSYITGCEPDECYSVVYRLDCGADGTPTPSFPGPSSCANVSNVKCKLTMDKPKCAEKVNGSTAMCVTVNYETTAYNASCGSVNTCTTLTQCGPDSVTILPAAYVYTFDGKGKFHWNADGANEVITGINGGLDGATTCSPWLYDSSYPVREIKGGVGSIYYSRSFSIINGQYRQ